MVRLNGFLGVDVLAGLARVDARQRSPVLRRGDHDRIDVVAVENLPVVLVHVDRGILAAEHRFAIGVDIELAFLEVHVGDRDDSRFTRNARRRSEVAEHLMGAASDADPRQIQPIVCAGTARRCQDTCRKEIWRRHACRCGQTAGQKVSTWNGGRRVHRNAPDLLRWEGW